MLAYVNNQPVYAPVEPEGPHGTELPAPCSFHTKLS